jgi:hypothetical protein
VTVDWTIAQRARHRLPDHDVVRASAFSNMFRKQQQPVWFVNSNPAEVLRERTIAARRRANSYPICEPVVSASTSGSTRELVA